MSSCKAGYRRETVGATGNAKTSQKLSCGHHVIGGLVREGQGSLKNKSRSWVGEGQPPGNRLKNSN